MPTTPDEQRRANLAVYSGQNNRTQLEAVERMAKQAGPDGEAARRALRGERP